MSQETLVEKHLRGATTEEEDERLEADPKAWKDELTKIIIDCDREMQTAKARSIEEKTPAAKLAYEQVKIICIAKKQKAVEVSRELKEQLRGPSHTESTSVLSQKSQMVIELQAIRAILERMEQRA